MAASYGYCLGLVRGTSDGKEPMALYFRATCTFFSTYSDMAAVGGKLLAVASAVAERRGVTRCCVRGGGIIAYGDLHPRWRSV